MTQLAKRHRRRSGRRSTSITVASVIYGAISCFEFANAGQFWEPIAAVWPGNLVVHSSQAAPSTATATTPGPPIGSDTEKGSTNIISDTSKGVESSIKPKRGWFGRSKPSPDEEEVVKGPGQDLIEEATKAILQRQEALQQEASRIMEKIESIASTKSQSMQESLIEHANQRQQELAQEVERLSEWTERLVEDRANRVEAQARATLEALDRAVVEEGRRVKLMGMALAENTLSQAEQKALEGLVALEHNAIEQVVKLASHVLESITKGKKHKRKQKYTPVAIFQRNFLGKGESSRLLVMVRSSSVLLAILLAISSSYWERMGGNAAMQAIVPGNVAATWLFEKNPHAVRPLASVVCAISAILLTWRFSTHELVAQRFGALLLFFIGRAQTIETTLMSLMAIAFLLLEQKKRSGDESKKKRSL